MTCTSGLRFMPRRLGSRHSIASRFQVQRFISTLNPDRLSEADYLDLSGQSIVRVPVTLSDPSGSNALFPLSYSKSLKGNDISSSRSGRRSGDTTHPTFPEGTQGFLYYKPGPTHAPVAGEVRFRITTGKSREDFESGTDLETRGSSLQRTPWRIPLCNIASSRTLYKDLRRLLLEEGHGPAEFLAGKNPENTIAKRGTVIMHSLDRELWVPLQSTHVYLPVIHVAVGTRIERIRPTLLARRPLPATPDPTAGIWCRLEPTVDCAQKLVFRVRVTRVVGSPESNLKVGNLICGRKGALLALSLPELEPLVPERVRERTRSEGDSTLGVEPRSEAEPRKLKPIPGMIQHLRTNLLTSEDYVHLSHSRSTIRLSTLSQFGIVQLMYDLAGRVPFPPSTSGFFYCDVPDDAHPVGASLRFRVTASSDPITFSSGHDLRTPQGHAWSRPLPCLVASASRRGNASLGELLVQQGLVSQEAIDKWRSECLTFDVHANSCIVTPTSNAFVWDLQQPSKYIHIGHGWKASKVRLLNPYRTIENLGKTKSGYRRRTWSSYRGNILARLEADDKLRTVRMRVVKLLGPVSQVEPAVSAKGIDELREGDLVGLPKKTAGRIWNLWHPNSPEIPTH